MRSSFRISVLFNFLLSGLVCCLIWKAVLTGHQARPVTAPVAEISKTTPSAAPSVAANPPSAEPKPFRWRQLESADYRVYVSNLRAIGCPEQTVRDIICADVDSMYTAKRNELHLTGASGPWSFPEERAFIAALLESGLETREQAVSDGRSQAAREPAAVPLVFQVTNLAGLKLEEGQLGAINDLREMFVAKLGGTSQNPDDPAYHEAWRKAQAQIDDMLSALIGAEEALKMESLAAEKQALQVR
jgi:hypothetical protein